MTSPVTRSQRWQAMVVEPTIVAKHVQDHARPFELIFEVRRVYQDLLLMLGGKFQMFQEDDRFVLRVLI